MERKEAEGILLTRSTSTLIFSGKADVKGARHAEMVIYTTTSLPCNTA